MPIAIWERYFLQQFFRMFALFLFCFYGFYVLIDYASHTSSLSNHQIQLSWNEVTRYYLYVFASRAEILIPIALLLSFVHTVCTLNNHQELVALRASGFSLKLLMRPFVVIGLLAVFLIYANEEFLLPQALKKLRRIEDATKHQKHKKPSPLLSVHQVMLEDGSLLIFQNYDTAKERFFDVYWIQSIDHIYRMKYLSPSPNPTGYFVDHLIRQSDGKLLQAFAYRELSFPTMKFNPELLQSTILEPEILSLSELAHQSFHILEKPNEKESKILTAFYWKLIMPWMCLLAIIAPAPFCVAFSRHLPLFLIYICSLFGLITFYMFMDATQVIAKRQVFAPIWAICFPFLLTFAYFSWRFKKLK